jgi:hypothetical protein
MILVATVTSGALRGAKMGFTKSAAALVAVFVSLIISLVLSPRISQLIAELILEIVKVTPMYIQLMLPESVYIDMFIVSSASMVMSSVLFLLVYILMKMILTSVFYRMYKKIEKEKNPFPSETAPGHERNHNAWGAAVGGISAFLSVVIVFAPITGTMRAAQKTIEIIDKSAPEYFAHPEAHEQVEAFYTYASDGMAMMLYTAGGEIIYTSAASATVNGETVYMVHELNSVEAIMNDFLALYPLLSDPINKGDESAKYISSLCDNIERSKMIDIVMAEFLPNLATVWLHNEPYMMIPRPELNELIDPVFEGVLEICADSDIYNVKDNTTSLLRIYAILLSSGILSAGDDFEVIVACLRESDLLAKLDAEIERNPNMEIIKTYTAEIAMRALADKIYGGVMGDIAGGITEEDCGLLAEKLADAISTINNKGYGTMEEKVSAMMSYAQEYLSDYGVDVPEELAAPIAETMLSQIGSGEISAGEIEEFLKGYMSK